MGRTARRPRVTVRGRPLPYLQRYQFVETSEPEVARDAVARAFRDVSLEPGGSSEGLYHNANHLAIGPFGLGCAEASGFRVQVSALQDFYVLLLPIDGSAECSYGRDVSLVAPGRSGTIHSTQRPCKYDFGSGLRTFAVRLPRERLESHFGALLGSRNSGSLEFSPAIPEGGPLEALTRLVIFFAGELDRHDTLLASEAVLHQFEDLILTVLLLHQPHSGQHSLERRPPAASLQHVRAAETYMEANGGHALRMQDVARAARIGLRSLELAFRRHRGYSPGEFLRALRLERAHQLLAAGNGTLTVTGVAHACGFLHLGQFAADYRKRFGRPPSHTLRDAR